MKIIFYTLNRVEASEYLTTQWVHSNDNNNDMDKERRQLLWMGKLNNLSISRRPQHNFKNTDTYPKNRDLFGEPVIHTRLGEKVGHRDPPSYTGVYFNHSLSLHSSFSQN